MNIDPNTLNPNLEAVQPQAEAPTDESAPQANTDDILDQLVALMSGLPDAPSKEQLLEWKQQFGEIHVLPLTEQLVVIYRALTRAEYREIVSIPVELRRTNPEINDDQLQEVIEDEFCKRAVLYPYNIAEHIEKAGMLSKTLSEQIQLASYLIPTELAASLVIKI